MSPAQEQACDAQPAQGRHQCKPRRDCSRSLEGAQRDGGGPKEYLEDQIQLSAPEVKILAWKVVAMNPALMPAGTVASGEPAGKGSPVLAMCPPHTM